MAEYTRLTDKNPKDFLRYSGLSSKLSYEYGGIIA